MLPVWRAGAPGMHSMREHVLRPAYHLVEPVQVLRSDVLELRFIRLDLGSYRPDHRCHLLLRFLAPRLDGHAEKTRGVRPGVEQDAAGAGGVPQAALPWAVVVGCDTKGRPNKPQHQTGHATDGWRGISLN